MENLASCCRSVAAAAAAIVRFPFAAEAVIRRRSLHPHRVITRPPNSCARRDGEMCRIIARQTRDAPAAVVPLRNVVNSQQVVCLREEAVEIGTESNIIVCL